MATPPTIPRNSLISSDATRTLRIGSLVNGTVTLSGGTMTGLNNPTNPQDGATKGYVDDSFAFITDKTISSITTAENVTYTGTQLVGGFITRDTSGGTRTDTFPTAADIVSAMGSNATNGTFFDVVIQNVGDSDDTPLEYITLDLADLTLVGASNNPRINPESAALFRILVTNATSGSEAAEVYYYNNIYGNIGGEFYAVGTSFRADSFRSTNLLTKDIPVFFSQSSEDLPDTLNTEIRLIEQLEFGLGGSGSTSISTPDASDITTALGLDEKSVKAGDTYLFTVQPIISSPSGTTSLTITAGSGITLDSDSNFVLSYDQASPNGHLTSTYAAVADTDATNAYTIYSLYSGRFSKTFTDLQWETQTTIPYSGILSTVAWSDDLSIYLALDETVPTGITSPDGITWFIGGGPGNTCTDLIWVSDLSLFIETGSDIQISADGITWVTVFSSAVPYDRVAYSPDLTLLAAVGALGNITTSPDGTSWTSQTVSTIDFKDIAWSSSLSLFVAIGTNAADEDKAAISSNGIGWSVIDIPTLPDPGIFWSSLAWSPDLALFTMLPSSGTAGLSATSINGTNWTTYVLQSPPNVAWEEIIWVSNIGAGTFISAGNSGSGTGQILVSENGSNWNVSEIEELQWIDLAYSPTLNNVVAVSNDGAATTNNVGVGVQKI